ncbi:sugar ABC transporter substrate-binding protein [Nonomuraea soli]|uniref:Ribose transport system substrate-binding protein n=1 Tax=Nonomuraea soli TaxID=1032476 RepID=A0A7W0CFA1_9ACTN|nr:sugar ABC transporter substrate-binding protein [Nonomuraea soli]MBA2890113.1 ribose transport system substrate-binding protein [Nonomuraea soli]
MRSLALAGLSAALLISACGSNAGPPASTAAAAAPGGVGCAETDGKTVGFSQPLADPNFAVLEQIVTKVLGDHGVSVKSVNANLDPGKQIADIQSLLQQQVAVLIANPVDPNATKPVFDRARQQNVPIVALDTEIGGPFFTTVKDDVTYAAEEGARLLKEAVGDGKVAAVYGPPFAELLNWEKAGFDKAARESGLNVVETGVNQEITPARAKQLTDAWKQKHGAGLKGIWTFNDVSAIGAASSTGGDFSPVIVSINGQPDVVPLIKAGKVLATFSVPYEKTGQAMAYAALRALCGGKVPDVIHIPTAKLDKSNVGSYRPLQERVDDAFDIVLEERDGKSYVKVG